MRAATQHFSPIRSQNGSPVSNTGSQASLAPSSPFYFSSPGLSTQPPSSPGGFSSQPPSSPGGLLLSPGVSTISRYSSNDSLHDELFLFADTNFAECDQEYHQSEQLLLEEAPEEVEYSFSSTQGSESNHSSPQIRSVSGSEMLFSEDNAIKSYELLKMQLQEVSFDIPNKPFILQIQNLVELICSNSCPIFSDISKHREFFLNEVQKLGHFIQEFLQKDQPDDRCVLLRDGNGSCQIDRFPDGNRIILWGLKRVVVEGSSSRFKPHNLVFYCDQQFTQVTHYGDIVNSTSRKNTYKILSAKPDFIHMIKMIKQNGKVRISFAQLNQGVELFQIILNWNDSLSLEIKNQIILAIFIEFIRVSKIQWGKSEVFTDIKTNNMLLSLKNKQFTIKFIDYVFEEIADGTNRSIPVTGGKLPCALLFGEKESSAFFLSKNLNEYIEKNRCSPFFNDSDKKPSPLIHPIVAYTQLVVACMELFLGKSCISQSSKEERLEARRNLDAVLAQLPELTDDIFSRQYYDDACDYIVRTNGFCTL